jgi:phosphoribosylamine--glycine ligase
VFHAGTRREDDGFYTHGGRILGVSATGRTLEDARAVAYPAVDKIHIEGAHYRSDIGLDAPAEDHAAGTKVASGAQNG